MERTEAWKILSELAQLVGVELFDVDLPGIHGGVLRVYLFGGKDRGITHEQCAAMSNLILDHARVEELMPGSTTLEVSSPGINRKLTRGEHFEGAVGERVRVTFLSHPEEKRQTVFGTLLSFDGSQLSLEDERAATVVVPFSDLQEARVDYLFK